MRYLWWLSFLLFQVVLSAQNEPVLYGKINISASNEPLEGATVLLINPVKQVSTISNESGDYFFENVNPGRYEIQVDYLGYQSQRLVELLIESGRSLQIDIQMVASPLDLPVATVRAGLNDLQSDFLPSVQVLTIEETRRLPATFNDPARQIIAYPGVVNTNDQANNISVRGNSPASMSWRLEGVEIVNPNHLSNAGTRSDQITLASGGVNILSAQMLNTSAFYAGAAPIQFGNVQGGLMDMRLRSGNREKWEGTFQLGLLGLDASFEGPFSKNKNSSYLINYRYSTLGLLNALGVELGDEAIQFQDIAIHMNFPTKKFGTFSFFGMGGNSDNVLVAERDSSIWEFTRDRSDIDYDSGMQLFGGSHKITIGKKSVWNTTFIFSRTDNLRTEYVLNNTFDRTLIRSADINSNKSSLVTKLQGAFSSKMNYSLGAEWTWNRSNYFDEDITVFPSRKFDEVLSNTLRPFASLDYQLNSKVSFELGAGTPIEFWAEKFNIDARLGGNLRISDAQKLKVNFQRSFRRHAFNIYMASPINSIVNKFLDPIRTDLISLEHQLSFKSNSVLKTGLYFQKNNGAITSTIPSSLFSSLNSEELFFPEPGNSSGMGQGRNYGLEVQLQKFIQEDFYFILNGSFFKSEYKNHDLDWRPTRYDAGYISNATVGKEFRWTKNKKDKSFGKTLGLNLRLTYLGNLRYTPINLVNSIEQNNEVLDLENVFSEKLKPYAKGDLRIYLRTDKAKYSNSLSLDIQNFFNRKNDGYFFFDQDSEMIVEKKQLGLIPILNWRLSF